MNNIKISNQLKQISPKFEMIYDQALKAEELGLLELVGPGLRKALEFLVKDFLIHFNFMQPDHSRSISLYRAIQMLKLNTRDNTVLNAIRVLGKEEVHYDNTHSSLNHKLDIANMKTLLNFFIQELELSLETESIMIKAEKILQK